MKKLIEHYSIEYDNKEEMEKDVEKLKSMGLFVSIFDDVIEIYGNIAPKELEKKFMELYNL